MQFLHTWQAILEGRKTQTRRLVKTGDMWSTPLSVVVIGRDHGRVIDTIPSGSWPSGSVYAVYNSNRTVYAVGKTYAVQPGRSKPAVARIRIASIRREDVRNISEADAIAEGFGGLREWSAKDYFLETWIRMHDKQESGGMQDDPYWSIAANPIVFPGRGGTALFERPAEFYDAWVLVFEVVKDEVR